MGLDFCAVFGSDDILSLIDNTVNKLHPFIQLFKSAWADTGDNLSKLYAGTGSTTSSVARGGSSL